MNTATNLLPVPDTTNGYDGPVPTAAAILRLAIRMGENLAEWLDGHPHEANIWARAQNAHTLGFYTISPEGEFTLTAKGEDFLAKHPVAD